MNVKWIYSRLSSRVNSEYWRRRNKIFLSAHKHNNVFRGCLRKMGSKYSWQTVSVQNEICNFVSCCHMMNDRQCTQKTKVLPMPFVAVLNLVFAIERGVIEGLTIFITRVKIASATFIKAIRWTFAFLYVDCGALTLLELPENAS